MAVRRIAHARHHVSQPKPAPARKKVEGAVIYGEAYSIDKIQELISDLMSFKSDRQITAAVEFFEHPAEIAHGLSRMPEINYNEFMDLIVYSVIRNQAEIIQRLENERNAKALRFLSDSIHFPPPLRDTASSALARLGDGEIQGAAHSRFFTGQEYPQKKAAKLLARLENPSIAVSVAAAIEYVRDYQVVSPAISHMPMQSVTDATATLVKAVERNEDAFFSRLTTEKMLPELLFLSEMWQFPHRIRKKAQRCAAMLQAPPPRQEAGIAQAATAVSEAVLEMPKAITGMFVAPGLAPRQAKAPSRTMLPAVLSVKDIKEAYAMMSTFYGIIEDILGRGLRMAGLALLSARRGERVLEIGFGTGAALAKIAEAVGKAGMAHGIDITPEMVRRARERLRKSGQDAAIREGDARKLPYKEGSFDAVYMSETLEILGERDMQEALGEIRRVLKPSGRLVLVCMDRAGHESSIALRIYEWFAKLVPKYANCRPIYPEDALQKAGFRMERSVSAKAGGLIPMRIILARPVRRQ
jgi:ubiquinone/menaquinone biosynthesis C-methylase UbiE